MSFTLERWDQREGAWLLVGTFLTRRDARDAAFAAGLKAWRVVESVAP